MLPNYTKEEIDELYEFYAEKGADGCPKCLARHKRNSIYAKVSWLGIKRKAWTTELDDEIISEYPFGGWKACRKCLEAGKSKSAIQRRAWYYLKIRYVKKSERIE